MFGLLWAWRLGRLLVLEPKGRMTSPLRGAASHFLLSEKKVTKESRPLAGGLGAQTLLAWWFRGAGVGFDEAADATGLLACGVAGGVRFVVALHDGDGPGPSGCCRDRGGCPRYRDGADFVVGAVAPA